MSRATVRPLKGIEELSACVELQKKTWGAHFEDVVSAALMLVTQKIGSVAAGAFDDAGRLLGILFGITGIRADQRVHWSHMLAVEPAYQGQGLGRLLKLYQRHIVAALGVRTMYWTFDPLESRNAHFNVNRLKVQVEGYVTNMYGAGETSPLHSGIGTDRFVVRWDLESDRVEAALRRVLSSVEWRGDEAVADLPFGPEDGIAHPDIHPPDGLPGSGEDEKAVIEIPSHVQSLKSSDPEAAVEWRTYTRTSFSHYLSRGYTVTSFMRDAATARCFYVLERT